MKLKKNKSLKSKSQTNRNFKYVDIVYLLFLTVLRARWCTKYAYAFWIWQKDKNNSTRLAISVNYRRYILDFLDAFFQSSHVRSNLVWFRHLKKDLDRFSIRVLFFITYTLYLSKPRRTGSPLVSSRLKFSIIMRNEKKLNVYYNDICLS